MNEKHDGKCYFHEGVCKDMENVKLNQEKQWNAIGDINKSVSKIQVNIAMIVGGIAVAQFIAVMVFK